MTSCIATIVKDEQEYLDEWIQYHLNLGINHIFIFEDLGSESHNHITSKYPQVTLNTISSILTDDDLELVKQMRANRSIKTHSFYLDRLLSYISHNYSKYYDWCFTTDVEKDISSTLSLYDNYDAIVLRWKNYGANGLISKPDYSKVKVIEVFTKEMLGTMNEKSSCLCKVCYNLKKYKPEFFANTHNPSDLCNYCNTNFVKSCSISSFRNIYLKHYVTRSWEEYVWKVKVRGYMYGLKRTYDAFFDMNPDMRSQKTALLLNVNN